MIASASVCVATSFPEGGSWRSRRRYTAPLLVSSDLVEPCGLLVVKGDHDLVLAGAQGLVKLDFLAGARGEPPGGQQRRHPRVTTLPLTRFAPRERLVFHRRIAEPADSP